MRRALLLLPLLIACKDKSSREPPAPTAIKTPEVKDLTATPPPEPIDRPKIDLGDGPTITPIITSSITFAVPKAAPWWGEMSFSCYAAAIRLQPGSSPSEAFTKVSPAIAPALAAADIDLDKDFAAFGLWGCGEGACAYLALQLRKPEMLGGMISRLAPGTKPKTLGKLHWTVEAPGAQGPRNITVRAVPIAWPDKLPNDLWSREAARATHVVFLTGLFDKTTEVDAIAAMADPKTAAAKVADVEAVVSDTHGRCVLGEVGKRAFRGKHSLDRARFAMVAPEGKGDALTKLIGSIRTLDLEVKLVLSPAPTDAIVKQWVAEARQWLITTMEPVRASMAGQGPIVDVMFEVGSLLGKSGFVYTIADKELTLSFRTDRITSGQLMLVESKLQSVIGAP